MEFVITGIIIAITIYIIYKNIRKKPFGSCNCTSCNQNCPAYKNNIELKK